jgi:hypothetical protein
MNEKPSSHTVLIDLEDTVWDGILQLKGKVHPVLEHVLENSSKSNGYERVSDRKPVPNGAPRMVRDRWGQGVLILADYSLVADRISSRVV